MSLGLQTLNSTFGTCGRPRIGWQIDPFGHSKEQASILANMGYDGLFFGRLDWRDKTQREDTLAMEMVWQASEELAEASDLFTGVLFNSYSPPDDFCWDLLCNDAPLMDNPLLENNIEERIASFLAYVEHQAKYYKSNHIMLTMGMDFHYQAAHAWFMNLDKLISHVNQLQTNGSNVHVFYSTPHATSSPCRSLASPGPQKRTTSSRMPLTHMPIGRATSPRGRPPSGSFARLRFIQNC